jgi:GNAT superfamily N-acetyltransferase
MNTVVLEKPTLELEIRETGWQFWPYFVPHHYLDLGPMPFSTAFVGFVDGEPVAHLGMSAMVAGKRRAARACRLVILPEWQGAGVGTRFLDYLCERELKGEGFVGYPTTTYFHTNHPGLCFVLRRSKKWRQVSTHLYGASRAGVSVAERQKAWGWGRHFRAVQGFQYHGQRGVDAAKS